MLRRPFGLLVVIISIFAIPHASFAQKIASVFPLGGRKGSSVSLEIRGQGFEGVYAVWFAGKGLRAQLKKVEPIEVPAPQGDEGKKNWFRALVDLKIDSGAEVGRHALRLVSPRGISPGHPFVVTDAPIVLEVPSAHSTTQSAQPLKLPTLLAGKLWDKGEVDFYSFEALPGEELAFHAVSNQATPTNGGGFDAIQFSLYENGGTWFDPHRPLRLASSDLPRLNYKFSKGGRYLLEVGAFSGISGPDVVYLLEIKRPENGRLAGASAAADLPDLQESGLDPMQEAFSRTLQWNRTEVASSRTIAGSQESVALHLGVTSAGQTRSAPEPADFKYHPADQPSRLPEISSGVLAVEGSRPVLLEGVIDRPNKVNSYTLKISSGQHLAFELQTPATTVPEFNPLLTLLGPDGQEVFNNIWFRVGPVVESRLKSLEPKVVYNFDRDGEYTLRVRDLTPRFGNPSFRYRILIRPQIPHIGKVKVKEEQINVQPGKAEKLTVTVPEEEGYSGAVALAMENLPPGVQALTSTEVPPDPEPLLDKGKMEEFVPKNQRVEILVAASREAPAMVLPQVARLVARPVIDGDVGSPAQSLDIPLMVVSAQAKEQSHK